MKMIYQTHAIRSVEDFKHQKELSNILVDFVDPLGILPLRISPDTERLLKSEKLRPESTFLNLWHWQKHSVKLDQI
jgi:hypothetical protein